MSEDFAFKGAEKSSLPKSEPTSDELLFQDAYSSTEKCMGGAPGVKCGGAERTPNDSRNPILADGEQDNEVYYAPNSYPGVYYGPPVGILNDGSNAHLFKRDPELDKRERKEEEGLEKINKDREHKIVEKREEALQPLQPQAIIEIVLPEPKPTIFKSNNSDFKNRENVASQKF